MTSSLRTVSFKIPVALDRLLDRLAESRGCSRSAIVRELLEALASGGRPSVAALARDLVGSVRGPRNLSTDKKRLAGYGRCHPSSPAQPSAGRPHRHA